MIESIATALSKLDQAIQLLQESQRQSPRSDIEVVIATLESARDDLIGRKPN